MIGRFFRLVGRQMNVQLKTRIFNQYTILLFFLQPLVFSAVGMILARAAGNATPDLVYTVIGGGIMGMWSGLVFTSTYDITRDRLYGTLELIVGSPTSLGKVEAIRTFTNVMSGLVSLAAAFLAAMLIFNYSLAGANLLGALISLLLILFGLWTIGIFLADFLIWSRLSDLMVDFVELPVAVLCGFMYPLRILPYWMQAISAVFPIRWALQALDECLSGSRDLAVLGLQWGLAFGISLVFWALARWLEGKVHDLVRVSGELNSI
ncbi:MAG: ABC transporter permease [Anaerolineaceae bacterium]|nr:ABC transporter permease [Anaerolineaceae bacterium]